uniref:uncharacterized protein isoform X2 n=1 Tax=Myxine glutinosa TaxID=7769 RepID=UPI00358FC12B
MADGDGCSGRGSKMDMPSSSGRQTDWTKCCLCQQDKKEDLKSPVTNPTKREADGYSNIATNIPQFHSINALPIMLDPVRLDEGGGIDVTLRRNNAKYHQSCRLLFSNSKLQRAIKRMKSAFDIEETQRKRQKTAPHPTSSECFLCDKEVPGSALKATTMQVNDRINDCAKIMRDGKLIVKLGAEDVLAQEMKYHPTCLTALYNRERAHLNTQEYEKNSDLVTGNEVYPAAFSELVTYITETRASSERTEPVVFKLADLLTLYQQRLEQLGVESPNVNSTRLKEQLLSHVPQLEARHEGQDLLLIFKDDLGSVLVQANKYGEALHLAKAAGIVRREMVAHNSKFESRFHAGNVEDAIPPSLLQFVCNIEHGSDIKSQLTNDASKSDIAIAQLLQYNCFGKYMDGGQHHRYSKDHETPFAVYVGLLVFAKTRKRKLIDILHENGICISYERVLEISAQLGDAALTRYEEDAVVCPSLLRKGLFTASAMGNIDHDPTATTANTSFHDSNISIFQHPSIANTGEECEPFGGRDEGEESES